MFDLTNLVGRMQTALDRDDITAMRQLLDAMRRGNVGEAYVPGLRELCRRARDRLSRNGRVIP